MVEVGAANGREANEFAVSKGGAWVVPRGEFCLLLLLFRFCACLFVFWCWIAGRAWTPVRIFRAMVHHSTTYNSSEKAVTHRLQPSSLLIDQRTLRGRIVWNERAVYVRPAVEIKPLGDRWRHSSCKHAGSLLLARAVGQRGTLRGTSGFLGICCGTELPARTGRARLLLPFGPDRDWGLALCDVTMPVRSGTGAGFWTACSVLLLLQICMNCSLTTSAHRQ